MNIDYLQKIEESIKFTWKYKYLWIFGLFLSLFGSGGINVNLPNYDRTENENVAEFNNDLTSVADSFALMLVILVIALMLLLIAIVGWYLLSVSKVGLTRAVQLDHQNKDISFRSLWKYGQGRAFELMKMDVIFFLINLTLAIPLIITVFVAIIFPPFILCLCLLGLFYILYYIVATMVYAGAQRYLVLEDASALTSLKAGFNLTQKAFLEYIFGFLVSLLPGCVWLMVWGLMAIAFGVVFLALILMAVVMNPVVGLMFIFVFALITLALISVVNSPFMVFIHTYWTKIIMELMKK